MSNMQLCQETATKLPSEKQLKYIKFLWIQAYPEFLEPKMKMLIWQRLARLLGRLHSSKHSKVNGYAYYGWLTNRTETSARVHYNTDWICDQYEPDQFVVSEIINQLQILIKSKKQI